MQLSYDLRVPYWHLYEAADVLGPYTDLKVELIGTGEQSGSWGTTTNTNQLGSRASSFGNTATRVQPKTYTPPPITSVSQ